MLLPLLVCGSQVSLFEGTCYVTPLLGAYLADARWGRYKTILVFSCIYMVVRTSVLASLRSPEGSTWRAVCRSSAPAPGEISARRLAEAVLSATTQRVLLNCRYLR